MRATHLVAMVIRALVPFRPALRRLKRTLQPYEDDRANSNHCITNGLEQLAALRAAGISVAGATVLELGSGWLPHTPDPKCLDDLRSLPLAARFRGKPAEDLAILTSLFVAVKPAA